MLLTLIAFIAIGDVIIVTSFEKTNTVKSILGDCYGLYHSLQ